MRPFNKIFCTGLGRTGTSSLTDALKILGLRICHFPMFISVKEAIQSTEVGPLYLYALHNNVFQGLSDEPTSILYKRLDISYPNSLFIHTVRDVDDWIKSKEWFYTQYINRAPQEFIDYMDIVTEVLYGQREFDANVFSNVYNTFNQDVADYFSDRDCLLTLDVTQGEPWEALCNFLDMPIPSESFPDSGVSKRKFLERAANLVQGVSN